MSSNDRNLNYRYTVSNQNTASDLSDQTFHRRLLKKQQSHAQHFILDLTDISPQNIQKFKIQLSKFQGSVYTSHSTPQLLQKTYHCIKNEDDFKKNINHNHHTLVFSPKSKSQAKELIKIQKQHKNLQIQWQFVNYDSKIKNSLTVVDIAEFMKKNSLKKTDLPFWNSQIAEHYELEGLATPAWAIETARKNIEISVVIPTFNNCLFLCNAVQHLLFQNISTENYEIIIVDDGSSDQTQETLYSLIQNMKQKVNIKYIYWPKINLDRGNQIFFRAGLARNIGAQYSIGEKLFFLDSDMLVQNDFIQTVINEFKASDVLQFSRSHITQKNSLKNPRFSQIDDKEQTYIEDEKYWNQLFNTKNWNHLHHHWKYTCTYALGMSKSDFYDCGRFKRHFVSYGFEDTDLGFRLYKKNRKFKLIQKPLLHLTNYSSMQYQNSKFMRDQLLRKTSKLLFLDHLDLEIFEAFKFYYQFEKPLFSHIKDAF